MFIIKSEDYLGLFNVCVFVWGERGAWNGSSGNNT